MKPTFKIVLVGLLSALLLVMQVSFSAIPNVELVSFLFIIYAMSFPFSMNVLISVVFVTLQMLVWGMGDWVIGYYWIWIVWVILIFIFKPILKNNTYLWAILSGMWGFLFGILFAVNHGLFYGLNYSLIYWIKGISFDIIHAISNYIIVIILLSPTSKLFARLLTNKGEHL